MTNAIVFDTETTGLPKPLGNKLEDQPKIIEICCVKLDDNLEVIDSYETLINPEQEIEPKITQITGITNDDLKGQRTFKEVYAELAEFFLGVDILVAHNLPFDRSLLSFELERLDKLRNFPWPIHHICTVQKSMKIEGYRLNLGKLYHIATGKEFVDAHRARADVDALCECFRYLIEQKLV